MDKQAAKKQNRDFAERCLSGGAIRALEGETNTRKFILSFSSEIPYDRLWGVEILDHSAGAVDLTRLNEIGCVLFNHDRNYVIGRVLEAAVVDGRGEATIEFDSDDASEKIFQKVRSGTLKGVSIGYRVDAWEEILPGKTSADGKYKGPCDIARKWTPFEISIVSVPADPTVGVSREIETKTQGTLLCLAQRQLQINKNKLEVI